MSFLWDTMFMDVVIVFLLIVACLVLVPCVYYLYKMFLDDLKEKNQK